MDSGEQSNLSASLLRASPGILSPWDLGTELAEYENQPPLHLADASGTDNPILFLFHT